MSDILCVTDRKLCREPFLARVEKIAAARPAGLLLREKDMTENEYRGLAKEVLEICRKHGTVCILHNFPGTAAALGCDSVHLPLPVLRTLPAEDKVRFNRLGASCHSLEEAAEAKRLGCTYITAGHIFDTDCKKGLPGRGLGFLEKICEGVSIPVYAIGGISAAAVQDIQKNGAAGVCVMSGVMRCENVERFLFAFRKG